MDQVGLPPVLRPECAADAAFFKVPGKAVGMDVDLDVIDAVTDRAFVGIKAMPMASRADYLGRIAADGP